MRVLYALFLLHFLCSNEGYCMITEDKLDKRQPVISSDKPLYSADFSIDDKIEEIKNSLSSKGQSITEVAYQMQCMGDSYLSDNDFQNAANCYVLSLVAVFDNYDLQQFFLRKGINYKKIPDLSKEVFFTKNTSVLNEILTETALRLSNN